MSAMSGIHAPCIDYQHYINKVPESPLHGVQVPNSHTFLLVAFPAVDSMVLLVQISEYQALLSTKNIFNFPVQGANSPDTRQNH